MGPLGEWLESLTFLINQQDKNEKLKSSKEMKQLNKLEGQLDASIFEMENNQLKLKLNE